MFAYFQSLAPWEIGLVVVAMVLVGVSRTGFRDAAAVTVPIFAAAFGGRVSASVVLCMFITADLMVINRFRTTAQWKILLRLAPFTVTGVILGTVFGAMMSDRVFAVAIGSVILVAVLVSVIREIRNNPTNIQGRKWLAAPLGVSAGFTSMVGNASGPLMTLYMLALGLRKMDFLGTAAWFFFTINVVKLPFHIFVWKTLSAESLLIIVIAVVPIALGTVIGARLVGKVSEKSFRIVSYVLAAVGSVRLIVA